MMTRPRQPATTGPPRAYPWPMPTMWSWLRGHPWQADGLLALVLFALSAQQAIVGPPQVVAAGRLVTALLAATVVLRRRWPVAALQPTMTDLAIPVLLYTLAAYRPRRISIPGLVLCLVGSAVAITRWAPAGTAPPGGVVAAAAGLAGVALTAWVLGDSVAYRCRRAKYAAVEERAARLEAERDAQARIAAAAERARELQERRARAVDESAARLRRIERDLHDGAQVRLTALAMALGEIKESLEQSSGDDRTLALAGAAHQNAKDTLAELRDLARGIHPPVLDRGLGPALGILAGTSAIPVALTVAVTERPSPANVTKHSGASHVTISVAEPGSGLMLTVTDDGDGGARLVPGGGLAGLLERVQTVDGA